MTCARGCCPTPKEHFRSVALTGGALVAGNNADRRLLRDMRSYRSMIDQGLEPKCMTGAADLEATARTAAEIEGRLPEGLIG